MFVGDTTCNYVLLNKVINLPAGSSSYSYTANYGVDIDADLVNDIVFDWDKWGQPGGSSGYDACHLKCSSASNFEFVYETSPVNCTPSALSLASDLPLFTPIKASSNWSLSPSTSMIYRYCLGWLSCNYLCGHRPYTGTKTIYLGFRKILPGDTIYGWVKLRTPVGNADEIVSYAFRRTSTTSTVTPVFTTTTTSVCAGSTINLNASPSGGSFFGAGVSGTIFTPPPSTITNVQNLYYSVGCTRPAVLTVTVNQLPNPILTNSLTSICNGDSLVLTVSPFGGTFIGTGISGNVFYSSVTGLGTQTISYSYTDGLGCSNVKSFSLNVLSAPTLSVSSNAIGMTCPGQSITLSATGANSYTWSTGVINNSIVITPSSSLIYTVTGVFAGGNCPSTISTISVAAGNPTVTATTAFSNICPGSTAFLSASGASNYVWSTGSTFASISTNPTITTTYSVIGTNNGICSDTAYVTQMVILQPTLSPTVNSNPSCPGDQVILGLGGGSTVLNYQLYDSITSQFLGSFAGGGGILFNPSTTTSYKIRIDYNTISNTCIFFTYHKQYVVPCVGINELGGKENNISIFPNPNNGAFEIKGIKEETIFISNELGQLISTKNLTQENNYSVKLSNLQSGIYFVGNNLYRQKVVVIK